MTDSKCPDCGGALSVSNICDVPCHAGNESAQYHEGCFCLTRQLERAEQEASENCGLHIQACRERDEARADNAAMREAMERADRISTGEDQVAMDDTEGMGVIHKTIQRELAADHPGAEMLKEMERLRGWKQQQLHAEARRLQLRAAGGHAMTERMSDERYAELSRMFVSDMAGVAEVGELFSEMGRLRASEAELRECIEKLPQTADGVAELEQATDGFHPRW